MLITFLQPKYNIWISKIEGCTICLDNLGVAAMSFKKNSFPNSSTFQPL